VQEAGRAGRDGQIARCILLFDESDLAIQEHLLALSRLSPALLGRFGRALAAWAGEDRDANIEELALSAGISQRAASSLVTTLVEAGICERVDAGRVRALGPLDTLVERVEGLRGRFEVLRREDARRLRAVTEYAEETGCRSAALRRYFGDEDPRPCGRCDLCRAQGMAEPARTGRRRKHRERRRDGGPAVAVVPQGGDDALAAGAAGPAGERRRRRRRGRRRAGPREMAAAAAPETAAPAFVLPPLDPAADDLAAELGAPGLPPSADAEPAAQSSPVPGRHRRRRRRRRGHGPRPEGAAPSTPTQA
jgi:hypothetical protein